MNVALHTPLFVTALAQPAIAVYSFQFARCPQVDPNADYCDVCRFQRLDNIFTVNKRLIVYLTTGANC